MKTKLKSFLPNWLLWAAALGLPYLGETATSQTFSDANWMSMGGIQGANGLVQTVAVDGAGNLYVGGRFNVIGDLVANYIAKWDGTRWSALGSGMSGGVSALVMSGSNLFAGGHFTTAGGSAANGIAKWDGTGWTPLGSGIAGDRPYVSALAVAGIDLYAGGSFMIAGGKVSAYIARAYLPTLPPLSIFRSTIPPGGMTVSWPSGDTPGFALEQAGALAAPSTWVTNAAGITDDGTNKSVTLSATNRLQLFRLRRP